MVLELHKLYQTLAPKKQTEQPWLNMYLLCLVPGFLGSVPNKVLQVARQRETALSPTLAVPAPLLTPTPSELQLPLPIWLVHTQDTQAHISNTGKHMHTQLYAGTYTCTHTCTS
jgi:hypothetical protein